VRRLSSALRHWLLAFNVAVGAFLAGAVAAPLLVVLGWRSAADGLYAMYHLACHQWAFRSFFVFGQQPVYSRQELADRALDPFGFVGGDQGLGAKLAFCERDLAIYVGLLLVGLAYARRREMRPFGIKPIGFKLYGMLILPMAVDGFTQLFGWRESTWEQRVVTGFVFGVASAWLVLPRLDNAFGFQPTVKQYAPGAACARQPEERQRQRLSHLLPRG
jgi:uncharacterized membrane protein